MSHNRPFVVGCVVGVSVSVVVGMLLGRTRNEEDRGTTNKKKKKEGGEKMVSESTIRLMTRLAIEHGAVNLSQGFPNEPPPSKMTAAAAAAILGGTAEAAEKLEGPLKKLVESALEKTRKDELNQYSFPFGAPKLRQAVAGYYERWYGWKFDAGKEITVVSGATEGFASCIRALCSDDGVCVFFQPFHELYPSQVAVFRLEARAVTLRESSSSGRWIFDEDELDAKLKGASLLLFNSPHNPTGHVFSQHEIDTIARLCRAHNVTAVTDEIYEHVYFDDDDDDDDGSPTKKTPPTLFASLGKERAVLCNSISKTAKATGWRIGWLVTDSEKSAKIRAVHDQLVACSATPLQIGVAALLDATTYVDPYLKTIGDEYLAKRDLLIHALKRAGFRVGPVPKGAYYVFADFSTVKLLRHLSPTDAAIYCITKVGVACVPGDNFYLSQADKLAFGSSYLRFAFVRSLDLLHDAAHRLDTHFLS